MPKVCCPNKKGGKQICKTFPYTVAGKKAATAYAKSCKGKMTKDDSKSDY